MTGNVMLGNLPRFVILRFFFYFACAQMQLVEFCVIKLMFDSRFHIQVVFIKN